MPTAQWNNVKTNFKTNFYNPDYEFRELSPAQFERAKSLRTSLNWRAEFAELNWTHPSNDDKRNAIVKHFGAFDKNNPSVCIGVLSLIQMDLLEPHRKVVEASFSKEEVDLLFKSNNKWQFYSVSIDPTHRHRNISDGLLNKALQFIHKEMRTSSLSQQPLILFCNADYKDNAFSGNAAYKKFGQFLEGDKFPGTYLSASKTMVPMVIVNPDQKPFEPKHRPNFAAKL